MTAPHLPPSVTGDEGPDAFSRVAALANKIDTQLATLAELVGPFTAWHPPAPLVEGQQIYASAGRRLFYGGCIPLIDPAAPGAVAAFSVFDGDPAPANILDQGLASIVAGAELLTHSWFGPSGIEVTTRRLTVGNFAGSVPDAVFFVREML